MYLQRLVAPRGRAGARHFFALVTEKVARITAEQDT